MSNEKPWLKEPNSRVWYDRETGLRCMISRANGGHLCGYVRLPARSKALRKAKAARKTWNYRYSTHGGITYGGTLRHQRGYWIGFDCAHLDDLAPLYAEQLETALGKPSVMSDGVYRDFAYVTEQVELLAKQVKEAK